MSKETSQTSLVGEQQKLNQESGINCRHVLGPKSLAVTMRSIPQSPTLRISEQSASLQASGVEVFKFGLGQSPFPVMKPMIEALRRHASAKDYMPTAGFLPLRETIAKYATRRCGHTRGPENVLIGPGTKELLFLVQMALDATLVLPSPSWVSYQPQARMLGRNVVWVHTELENDWKVQPHTLEETLATLVKNDPSHPILFVLNYPSNPTGATYTQQELCALATVFRRYNTIVVSDEIYCRYTFRDPSNIQTSNIDTSKKSIVPCSLATSYPEGTILSDGISKWAGAGGWRLGAFVFPQELEFLRTTMLAAASETFSSVSAPIQLAAADAFALLHATETSNVDTSSQEITNTTLSKVGYPSPTAANYVQQYIDASNHILCLISTFVTSTLRDAGATVSNAYGGFYVFPNFSKCNGILEAQTRFAKENQDVKPTDMTSEWLCNDMLQRTGVAILPGTAFGRPATELVARLAFVDFDGHAALSAVSSIELDQMDSTSNTQTSNSYNNLSRIYANHEWYESHVDQETNEILSQQQYFLQQYMPRVWKGIHRLSMYLTKGE